MDNNRQQPGAKPPLMVFVSKDDAEMIQKVRKILHTGKNVEIKQDARGNPKIFKVSREIEN